MKEKDTIVKPKERRADSAATKARVLSILELRLKKAKDDLEQAEKEQIVAFAIRSKARIEKSEIWLEQARSNLAKATRELSDAKRLKSNSSKHRKVSESKQAVSRKPEHKKAQSPKALARGAERFP